MNTEATYLKNNNVYLCGTVSAPPKYSHELYGEGFYEFTLCVPRLSGQCDYIPVTVSERLLGGVNTEVGASIALEGQFRSYNKMENNRSKLMLTVFVRDFVPPVEGRNPNVAELMGYICKAPVYRTTPFNREICDVLLAVNRAYNKSDYIPCIAWGRNARFVRETEVGQKITVIGRIQSREYTKKLSETESEVRVAYELSIGKLVTGDDPQPESSASDIPQDQIPSAAQEPQEAAVETAATEGEN